MNFHVESSRRCVVMLSFPRGSCLTLEQKLQNPSTWESSSSSEQDEDANSASVSFEDRDDDGLDYGTPRSGRSTPGNSETAKEKMKARRKVERQNPEQRAERRKNKADKLSRNLTAISASGGGQGKKSSPLSKGVGACFICGSFDHMKATCPRRAQGRSQKRRHQ